MNNWIEVITFIYPHEAHLAKNVLEASDITVIIKDELTAQVNNFYSNAIGGVKLFVEVSQVEEALFILKDAGYIKDESHNSEKKVKPDIFSVEYKEKCPYCNSTNMAKKKIPSYFFCFSILLLGFPIPFAKKEYICFDCNKNWIVR
jgi:hypothetical protein